MTIIAVADDVIIVLVNVIDLFIRYHNLERFRVHGDQALDDLVIIIILYLFKVVTGQDI
jgi:hypothetical protein